MSLATEFKKLIDRRKPTFLGVGISSSTVKVLEISEVEHRFRVESYAVETLPPNSVVEKAVVDVESVGEAIRRAIRKSGTNLRTVAACVPGSSVISKIITLQADLSEEELEAQVMIEADQHIPYPLEEVALDFEVLHTNEHNPELVDVLLVACRNENVETRIAALELGGLEPAIMDVEPYALENAFVLISSQLPDNGFDKTIAVIDIGSSMTTLYVLQNHETIYTREQVFGGQQLTEEIQRRYGLSYEEAGRAKRDGSLPDGYQTEVLEPFKQAIVQQVSRSLQFFFSSSRYNSVDHIVLAGGCSALPGLDELLEQQLKVGTTTANPFAAMSISSKVDALSLSADAPGLLVECGLALRSFD